MNIARPPFHVIIPARYASSRLPGKPLLDIGGKPMIQRVVECAGRSAAISVTVATDDARIERATKAFGGAAVMTSKHHPSGADRIAEAVDALQLADHDIIVNVQGDEPQMPPALINQVARLLAMGEQLAAQASRQLTQPPMMATASAPLDDPSQLHDPSVVKVVTDRAGHALYFSRAAIPRLRDEAPLSAAAGVARRHLGIYAYRCGYLRRFTQLGACPLEKLERLEQLRALWHGDKIACAEAIEIPPPGIDTRADLARARQETPPYTKMR